MHAGNALAALIGWAACRIAGGTLVLRIEDIDAERCRPEHERTLMEDLAWLGIDWDEGPDVGGDHGPYRQSERLGRYDALLASWHDQGLVYVCRCSRAQVRSAQSAPHLDEGGERPYPGTCRPVGGATPTPALLDDRGGYRLHVESQGDDAVVHWEDRWTGPQREDVRATSGDVLLGRSAAPTYQLAVVADDVAMGITDVVRGRDLEGSTGRQILLHQALASRPPDFAHHPLVTDDRGGKLSKRDRALTVGALREAGMTPETFIAGLARAIGLVESDVQTLSTQDLAQRLSEPHGWHDGPWYGPSHA